MQAGFSSKALLSHAPAQSDNKSAFLSGSVLGLRSAHRLASGAYWASMSDSLPGITKRYPAFGCRSLFELQLGDLSQIRCAREARLAARGLTAIGFETPTWQALYDNTAVPQQSDGMDHLERGEWKRGWQIHACSALDSHFCEHLLLPALPGPHQAILRSSSGPGSSSWLVALPTSPDTSMRHEVWQIAARRRLRLQLPLPSTRCPGRGCNCRLDDLGDHLVCCGALWQH